MSSHDALKGVALMLRLSSGWDARKRIDPPLAQRRSRLLATLLVALGFSIDAYAQAITYEATVFPEQLGWQRLDVWPERRVENGWFIQTFQENGQDFYRKNIGGISGLVGRFFMEWRAVTDNPEWLIYQWQTPTVVVAGGNADAFYHVVMTESAAVLLRDIYIPRVIVPISIGEPHTYRVEVYPDEYIWYIDGVVVDSGMPEGPYPDPNARVTWGSRWNGVEVTTAWDYVRLGRIPEDGSADYDSDGAVALDDFYFFHECLTNVHPGINGGPGNDSGPGCRFADFDSDGDTDLRDFAEFQNAFTSSP